MLIRTRKAKHKNLSSKEIHYLRITRKVTCVADLVPGVLYVLRDVLSRKIIVKIYEQITISKVKLSCYKICGKIMLEVTPLHITTAIIIMFFFHTTE